MFLFRVLHRNRYGFATKLYGFLFFSHFISFLCFSFQFCVQGISFAEIFSVSIFCLFLYFTWKYYESHFDFLTRTKAEGKKQTINHMENRFMNLSHGKNNTSITISNQYNSRKFDFDSVCKSFGRKISIMSASAAFSGFSISSVFFLLFKKVPQKTTIARFEYNENKMAKLNHNWKNNNNNNDGYGCDARMLLWFELLSNNNKIIVQTVAAGREEKRDKLLQKLIKDRTNQRMSEWTNWKK